MERNASMRQTGRLRDEGEKSMFVCLEEEERDSLGEKRDSRHRQKDAAKE